MENAALTVERPHTQEGDARAIARLIDLSAVAYRVAVNVLGSHEWAEDVVQQAYLAAVRQLQQGPPPAEERSWFLRVVTNQARFHLRSEGNRRAREVAVGKMAESTGPAPEHGQEVAPALRRALAALDEKYRMPLVLCYQENMTQHEAAAVLDIPESTLSHRVQTGLKLLREAMVAAGFTAAPAVIVGSLAQVSPAVPAGLATKIGSLVAGRAETAAAGTGGAGGGAGTIASGGGLAMKILAGIIIAGTVAGTAAVAPGLLKRDLGAAPGAPPAAAAVPADAKPVPANPCVGMQEREEVFEFAEKPKVAKEGEKWVVTFASKGACDATVAILDKDGRIIRHLASGVLGKNAPYPFQQNSLSQKVEWDGLKDDFSKAEAAGCSVRVSLGLKPKFERNLIFDPYHLAGWSEQSVGKAGDNLLVARDKDGNTYVITNHDTAGRVFDKDGKYVRTFFPPPAAEVEKVMAQQGYKFASTKWGDKVVIGGRYGFLLGKKGSDAKGKFPPLQEFEDAVAALKMQPGAGDLEVKVEPRPKEIPASTMPEVKFRGKPLPLWDAAADGKFVRMAADRQREEIYVCAAGSLRCSLFRFDGRTGEWDQSWFPNGELTYISECNVGPDGLLYLRVGGMLYGQWIVRVDHEGKRAVDFGGEAVVLPAGGRWTADEKKYGKLAGQAIYCGCTVQSAWKGAKVLYTGEIAHSCTHARGLYISPTGMIAAPFLSGEVGEYAAANGIPAGATARNSFVAVWDPSGNLPGSLNNVGDMRNGHGIAMDRDGNIYATVGSELLPEGQKALDGIAEGVDGAAVYGTRDAWGGAGTLLKFRGLGGKYPLNVGESAVKLGKGEVFPGALWAYGGITGQSGGACSCFNTRYDMDYFARHWIPSNQLYSVTVLDSNGNRIARLGRYGNVDDTEADLKAGGDGLRFAWNKALAVTDTALFAADVANRRILKAAIGYAAEETVPLP